MEVIVWMLIAALVFNIAVLIANVFFYRSANHAFDESFKLGERSIEILNEAEEFRRDGVGMLSEAVEQHELADKALEAAKSLKADIRKRLDSFD